MKFSAIGRSCRQISALQLAVKLVGIAAATGRP